MTQPQLLKYGDACKRLGISRSTYDRWLHDPACPLPRPFRINRRNLVVIAADIESYIVRRAAEAQAQRSI